MSLLSPPPRSPPLTRGSTATDSTIPLDTPEDEWHHPSRHGKSRAQPGLDDVPVVRARGPRASRPESYFAQPQEPPRGAGSGGAMLGRRGTTKELIGRFEAMGDARAPPARQSSHRAASRSAGHGPDQAGGASREGRDKSPGKGRSPIRQSFRNLLAVFKKTKPPAPPPPTLMMQVRERTEPGTEDPPSPSPPNRASAAALSLRLQIPQRADVRATAGDDVRAVCLSPVDAHTGKAGELLYLCHAPASSSSSSGGGGELPGVWMPCAAQLHTTHVLLRWTTAGGNPAPRLVPFAACVDVRSLAPADLAPDERAALPAGGGGGVEWRVFELVFEGRARERFAAANLAERATWVSAIWDAVLNAQEERAARTPVSESVRSMLLDPPTRMSTLTTDPGYTEEPAQEPAATRTRVSYMSARDLPPVPQDKPVPEHDRHGGTPATPARTRPPLEQRTLSFTERALSSLPAPPPETPTATRSSFLSPSSTPGSPSRAPSPSIRNLGQRSVVKQRLAQIERAGSESRPSTPTSPLARRAGSEMRRTGTGASTGSILNAYMAPAEVGESALGSALFAMRAEPKAGNLEKGGGGRSRLLDLPMADGGLFSPASRYSVDEGVEGLPTMEIRLANLAPPKRSHAPEGATKNIKPVLENLQDGVQALQNRSATQSTNIVGIRTQVDEVLGELRRLSESRDTGDPTVLRKLEELQGDISDNISGLRAAIEGTRGSNGTAGSGLELPGVAEVHTKLDALVELSKQARPGAKSAPGAESDSGSGEGASGGIEEVLTILKDAEEQRVTQMEQQTDSIRYLNQLNGWLEAFVKHGTSQIEGVAAGVQQLCKDLGPIPELQDAPQDGAEGGNEEGNGGDQKGSGSGLLHDVRRLLVENKEREQSNADMHSVVNGLIAAVQEDMRRNAEARSALTTESVFGMIDQQRQDQERMLRALATELSNDIRGERLRFVEAMKEATAINVQIHVEEFKKELTREVMLMTQEVTRLQRERQGLEAHIADLFAFYAKQKQGVKVGSGGPPRMPSAQGPPPVHRIGSVFPGALPPTQSVHRRPLPSPVPDPTRVQ